MLKQINYQQMKYMKIEEYQEMLFTFLEESKLNKDLTNDEVLVLQVILKQCDEFGYWSTFELKQVAKKTKLSKKKIKLIINEGLLNKKINGMLLLQAREVNFGYESEIVLYSDLAVWCNCGDRIDDSELFYYGNWINHVNESKLLSKLDCK